MEIQTEKAILMRSQVEMTNISFIGHRREGNPKDKMAKNLAELCFVFVGRGTSQMMKWAI